MISRLFRSRKRLDAKAPEDRLAALEALSVSDAASAAADLARLVENDPDPRVRQAALGHLRDEELLGRCLDDEALAASATARIAELIAAGEAGGLRNHPRLLALRLATDPGVMAELESADDDVLLAAVLAASRDQRGQLLTLPAFQRADMLTELERQTRDRDKNSNRFARNRLDEIRTQRADARGLLAVIDDRLTSLEKSPSAEATEARKREILKSACERDLAACEQLASALVLAGEPVEGLEALRDRLARIEVQDPAPAAPAAAATPGAGAEPATDLTEGGQAAAAPAATTTPATAAGQTTSTPVDEDFDELAAAFTSLAAAMETDSDFSRLAAERQRLTDRWLAHADRAPPTEAQHQIFEDVSKRFQTLARAHETLSGAALPELTPERIPDAFKQELPADSFRAVSEEQRKAEQARRKLRALHWPDWAASPTILTTARERLGQVEASLTRWESSLQAELTRLSERMSALEAAIDAGELKAAKGAAGEIRAALKTLPEHQARDLNRALGKASARLGELADWQTYATIPKREALVEAITLIAETPLPPRDQADRIKALRADWQALGPVSRAEDHQLLKSFNELAEKAFEPCRAYFAEQAEVRAENLQARERICAELENYLDGTDWSQTDFKAAERILRTAREEWRRFHPVDRTPGKALETRFEALQSRLHGEIKQEWDRNLDRKRAIVTQAQALADGDQDLRERIEAAKDLQQRWKAVGTTPRRPDQALWRDFRAACDAIFNARDDARRTADAAIQATEAEARALLDAFRERLNDESAALDRATLKDFQTRFNELPGLPDRLRRPLARSFDELMGAGEQVLRDARAAAAVTRIDTLERLDAEVAAIEQRRQAGEDLTFEAPDPLFSGRGEAGPALDPEALSRLVIEAEIAADLESAETELRMALQVELMNAGRGREALEADPDDLTRRWCAAGPKDATADPLRQRFFEAIRVLNRR
ncbi:MAG: DUF349 domain-containing protein [Pseudomonadota bacterium]